MGLCIICQGPCQPGKEVRLHKMTTHATVTGISQKSRSFDEKDLKHD